MPRADCESITARGDAGAHCAGRSRWGCGWWNGPRGAWRPPRRVPHWQNARACCWPTTTRCWRGCRTAPVRGVLRITAPVQFGRRHVAPVVSAFLNEYPEVQIELTLNDRNLDLIEERLDLAVRIGPLADSSLVAGKSAACGESWWPVPGTLSGEGMPRTPSRSRSHDTIFGMARSPAREWRFGPSPRGAVVRLSPRLLVDDVEAQFRRRRPAAAWRARSPIK